MKRPVSAILHSPLVTVHRSPGVPGAERRMDKAFAGFGVPAAPAVRRVTPNPEAAKTCGAGSESSYHGSSQH